MSKFHPFTWRGLDIKLVPQRRLLKSVLGRLPYQTGDELFFRLKVQTRQDLPAGPLRLAFALRLKEETQEPYHHTVGEKPLIYSGRIISLKRISYSGEYRIDAVTESPVETVVEGAIATVWEEERHLRQPGIAVIQTFQDWLLVWRPLQVMTTAGIATTVTLVVNKLL